MLEGLFCSKDLLKNCCTAQKIHFTAYHKSSTRFKLFLLNFKNEAHFITPFLTLLISLLLTTNWHILRKEL